MRIETGVDGDKDLILDLSEMGAEDPHRRVVSFTLREEEVMQLRDRLESYLDGRRVEFRAYWEKSLRDPAKPLPQRVSIETMVDIFESLADSGEPFYCVFTKQDGTERRMWAKVTGPIQYNYKSRTSYVNVIDLDLARGFGSSGEIAIGAGRKIVIQRVKSLVANQSEFIANGR